MAKVAANYEVLYIINPTVDEENRTALVEKFKSLIEANGTINTMEEWGMKKLAYLIEDLSEGYYVLVNFTSAPEFPAELDRIMRITDGIMRSLITVMPE